ncbi:MAG: hypothetical protein ACJA01_000320 [Saprospiraceae bacterium]|jgi:hypothetical protein
MTKIRNYIICFLICSSPISGAHAKSFQVSSLEGFENAQHDTRSGDSIIWSAGRYSDINLNLKVNDVVFQSAMPGSTVFTGNSTLLVSGSGNIVTGFQFIGGSINGDVVDISGSKNTIQHINIYNYDSHYYLRVRPNCQYNQISYCNFEAKPETQESSVVQIEASENIIGYHVVSHCSFKNHTAPEGAGADYGIEALRIGYSYQRMYTSRTLVEYCYFERCNGDYEIISCKARENLMRYNTFINNGPAHLTLRHGSVNMIYGNFFINGAGIRVKEGQNHTITNNYFDSDDYFSIKIQNHHFDPVDSIIIAYNTIINHGTLILGGKGDFPPTHVVLTKNLFSSKINSLYSEETEAEIWIDNVLQEGKTEIPDTNVKFAKFELEKNDKGLYSPKFITKFVPNKEYKLMNIFNIPMLDDDFKIQKDMMKQDRDEDSIGSYVPSKTKILLLHANANNTGPNYLENN